MLKVVCKPHRAQLRAGSREAQKLFVMLKVIPSREVAAARPDLALALVIDTSMSMRAFVDQQAAQRAAWRLGGAQEVKADRAHYHSLDSDLPTLLDQAIEACHAMLDDARLSESDQAAIVHFDDTARALWPLSPLSGKVEAHSATEELRECVGETMMGKGLRVALDEIARAPKDAAKRVFLLTDGATHDENECRALLPRFASLNAPIVAIGFGQEYNDELLKEIADATRGRPYHLRAMSEMKNVLDAEVGQSAREVVTDLQLEIRVVQGVRLDAIHRVHPSLGRLAEGETKGPYRLGNIAAGDFTVFILEFTIEGNARPPSRARLVEFKLSGRAAGDENTHVRALPTQDVRVEFSSETNSAVDNEVLGYVQQKNVGRLVENAMRQATENPDAARQSLQTASAMTGNLGNAPATAMLQQAAGELEQTGAISPGTYRTVALGLRTKTVKTSAPENGNEMLSLEEIRKLSGA